MGRVKAAVTAKRSEYARYSVNDYIVSAIREKLVGAITAGEGERAAQVAAGVAGLRSGWKVKLKELKELAEAGDEAGALEAFGKLAPGFKKPKGWDSWPMARQGAWLDQTFPLPLEEGE